MSEGALGEITLVRDAASCREWLDSLELAESERMAVIDRLWSSLERSKSPPDLVLEILEQARATHIRDCEAVLQEMGAVQFPMPAAQWRTLHRVLASLRMARDLYKRTYVRLVEDSGVSTHVVIPGSTNSLRTVMPLARALDYQARVLQTLMFKRVVLEPDEWLEFSTLIHHLRASTFLDVALPDEVPLFKGANARALFVYPLLLNAARPEAHDDAEMSLIDRLARRWAGKVGFRMDEDGRIYENRHGPTLALSDRCAVRLDTHRLVSRLQTRITALDSADAGGELRLPRGLTRERALRLLDELRLCWSEAYRPWRLQSTTAGSAALRFGPPALRAKAGKASQPAASGVASMAYVFGRYEHNTIIRMATGADAGPRNALAELMTDADAGFWQGRTGDQACFERFAISPLKLGTLVAVAVADPAADTADATTAPTLHLGRITSLQQAGKAELGSTRAQRVGVLMWPKRGQLVGLRLADDAFYEDVYYLPAGSRASDVASLIVAPGRWRSGTSAMLRTPQRDLRIHVEVLLEKGADFERIRIRLVDRT